MKYSRRKNMCIACIGTLIYIMLIGLLVPFVYDIADDRSMMEIVSGQYLGSPDAHTIFQGFWYSLVLTKLYALLPNVDWYALSYIILQCICLSLIIYRLLNMQVSKKNKVWYIFSAVLAFAALGLSALVRLTFTTTAAILGVTVIFWYMTAQEVKALDFLVLFLLCFLVNQIRPAIFFMILPVCGILWIFRTYEEAGKKKWNLGIPAALAVIFMFELLGNQMGYGSLEWKSYQEYNDSRSAVYDYEDYKFRPYEEMEAFYNQIGIEKKSRARTLMNYNYTADDRITPGFFNAYIEAYEKEFPSKESVTGKSWRGARQYLNRVLSGEFHIQHILALILYAGLSVWYFWKKDWVRCWKVVLVALTQIVLWIYLLYEGRIPERVIYSMNMMFLVTALLLFGEVMSHMEIQKKNLIFAVLSICLGVCAVMRIKDIREQNLELSRHNRSVEALKQYCMEHPENFYFNDVTSLAFSTYNVHLWQDEPYQMNYMSLGDWMSYSPIWQEKLDQRGITSVKEALYEQENVYLICSFDKGLEYLVKLYDGVTCTEVDKVGGYRIYQLKL